MADKFIEDANERYPDLHLVEMKKDKLKADKVYLIKSPTEELVGQVVSIDNSVPKKRITIKVLYKKVGDNWESAVVDYYEAGGAKYRFLEFAVNEHYKVYDKVPLRNYSERPNSNSLFKLEQTLFSPEEDNKNPLIPVNNREVRSGDVYVIKTKEKPIPAIKDIAPSRNNGKDVEYIGFIYSVIQEKGKGENNISIALLYKKNSYGEWENAVNHYEAGGIYYSYLNFDFDDASVSLFEVATTGGARYRRKQMKRKTRRHHKSRRKPTRRHRRRV
jgi:hypothetical protein